MIKYINIKTEFGIETWDSVELSDYNTLKEFRKEVKNIIQNYHLMGYNVYASQRKAK